ncbi:MAG: hypothetical protein HYZ53_10575 [Planctomycetes bacterium]|nr:hypothetical protein [Planctomycetota bacterium]
MSPPSLIGNSCPSGRPHRYRLRRRGLDLGVVEAIARETAWERSEPVLLRGIVRWAGAAGSSAAHARAGLERALAVFDGLRSGGELADLCPLPRGFRVAGVSVCTEDVLELAKLHVLSARAPRELYVKANWLSTHPRDGSLRLRFSYGAEVLDDWLDDPASARAALAFAEAVCPAGRLVTHGRGVVAALRRRLGARPRFLQPILYSNAPNGGALFHHDFVPGQAGVVFAQLAGSTGWLAVPKRVLAGHIQAHTRSWRDLDRLLAAMDGAEEEDEAKANRSARARASRLARLLNEDRVFTRRLADDGWFFALRPGDALLLPSQAEHDVAWHSVFTLGDGANLGLSLGVAACR